MGLSRSAVFLDRDGTLNVARGYVTRPEQLVLMPAVGRALRSLQEARYLLIVVTNQSAVARGLASMASIDEIHIRLQRLLSSDGVAIDQIYVCPHHPAPSAVRADAAFAMDCDCRKPKTGLIDQACRDFEIDRSTSWMVGDHTRDIETARRAGIQSILVRTGHGGSDREFDTKPEFLADDLAAAAEYIISRGGDVSVNPRR
ncbi:MAG TPA: HAD family hydrolase [Caulobacteraceae bacterium]